MWCSLNTQPLPKLPQPNQLPKNPLQIQKWIKPCNGHISSWNVSYGQTVKQGQVIAKSGKAGTSSGPHLLIIVRI